MLQLERDDRPIARAREQRESDDGAVAKFDFITRRKGVEHRADLLDCWTRLVAARSGDAGEVIGGVEIFGVRDVDSRAVAALLSEPSEEAFGYRHANWGAPGTCRGAGREDILIRVP
jgi:hypothetical protein